MTSTTVNPNPMIASGENCSRIALRFDPVGNT